MPAIEDLVKGSGYVFNRRVTGIPSGSQILTANIQILTKELNGTSVLSLDITPTVSSAGQIIDDGSVSGVGAMKFELSSSNTSNLTAASYYYRMTVTSDFAGIFTLEEGTILPLFEGTDNTTALSTNASSSSRSLSARVRNLIDSYLDTIIHDFRQLRVWDEHARRSANDPSRLWLTYQNWNRSFSPQVFDAGNNAIPPSLLQIDYKEGSLTVEGDDGNQDYFVTYEMNLFPSEQLYALLNLTLMEINSTAEAGTHLTYYDSLDNAPPFWDGPLVFGAVAKAFRRLQTDGTLWKNFLIWQEGTNGQQIASEASSYYQAQFSELSKSLKRGQFLAGPGSLYQLFTSKGFGGVGPYTGRFRNMMHTQTRITIY